MANNVNPYRLQYIPTPDRSHQVFEESTAFIPYKQRAEEMVNDQSYRQASVARENRRDMNADERDRISQQQRARELLMNNEREKQRIGLEAGESARRSEQQQFERSRLTDQEHEQLIRSLYYGLTPKERAYAAAELQRHGYTVMPTYEGGAGALPQGGSPASQTTAPSQAATIPVVRPAKKTSAADASLDAQLNGIDQRYSAGLGVAPGIPSANAAPPLLPGRRLVTPTVAQSNAMLSVDDPYNNIVK